jgi:hypothetical protein
MMLLQIVETTVTSAARTYAMTARVGRTKKKLPAADAVSGPPSIMPNPTARAVELMLRCPSRRATRGVHIRQDVPRD